MHYFVFPKIVKEDAMLVFIEDSSREATCVVNGKGCVVQTAPASAQIVELRNKCSAVYPLYLGTQNSLLPVETHFSC